MSKYNTLGCCSVTKSCLTLCNPMNRSRPGLPVHHQLRSSLRLTSIKSVMPSIHLILCRPLLLLPPILPSISVFSNESTLRMRWPKYWSFSFSIIPSKEIPGLVSFRMDWLEIMVSKWYHLGSEYWWQFWIFFFPSLSAMLYIPCSVGSLLVPLKVYAFF